MSNRPKDFKRIPIFYRDETYYLDNSSIIKSVDVRLPNDRYYQSLIKPINKRGKGRLKIKKIFDYLKCLTNRNYLFRY